MEKDALCLPSDIAYLPVGEWKMFIKHAITATYGDAAGVLALIEPHTAIICN